MLLSGEATDSNFIVIGFTYFGIEEVLGENKTDDNDVIFQLI